jgi:phosphoribosylanthranilate isomerase
LLSSAQVAGTAVKICGITSLEDAEGAIEAGADALGLNFYPHSPRCLDVVTARRIVEAIAGRVLTVGVFVDATLDSIRKTQEKTGFACVQLHGDEPATMLDALLPHAYKAVRVRDQQSIEQAHSFAGEHILLDAYVPGEPGGTGKTFRWELARELASQRKVTLAGGLHPDNVASAIEAVKPFCVDVASGVESKPGIKDLGAVRAFIAAAKLA